MGFWIFIPSLRTVVYKVAEGPLRFADVFILNREPARFNYLYLKRSDTFNYSIYPWCIEITIADSIAPVRLAWVPFLKVPKNGLIYVKADTKKKLWSIVAWCYGITNSAMAVALNCTFVEPLTIKRAMNIYLFIRRPTHKLSGYFNSW